MKISIALTTYNGDKYLLEQLKSYENQIRKPDEVIICDDVSSDSTIQIITSFMEKTNLNIKLIKNEKNLGYTKNFAKALSLSTGDIVFFSDQDDIWLDNKISVIERKFQENPECLLLIHDAEIVTTELESTELTKLGQILSGGYTTDDFATGTLCALKRELIDISLPFPNGISGGHDGWINYIAIKLQKKLVINNVLQKLRRHENNTSEWIASTTKKINKLDTLKKQASTKIASSYNDRLLNINELIKRFNQLEKDKKLSFSVNFIKINDELIEEKIALENRNNLVTLNFLPQKLFAIKMFINNDYKYFNGYKSFIRDLLRGKK